MNNQAVTFNGVTFTYEEAKPPILKNVSFSVHKGEFISILAPSGAGKSTIFRLLTKLEQPNSGSILLNGSPLQHIKNAVGYMPQQDLLLDWRTVVENAALPLELHGLKKKAAREKAFSYFSDFGLAGTEHQYPHQLSGGMRQRVSFLRAMLSGREVLLLDEPFSALDAMTRLSMQEWLLSIWKRLDMTILFVTHDIDEALILSDRIFLFNESPLNEFVTYSITDERPRLIAGGLFDIKQQILEHLRNKVKQ
ncbi:ABC transporter ATP-binding protein [Halalkalibacter urbisdiaboli]|uniref:ABC transporter ATP-binding protein n=1 Tax=Halalkalibacter urbisdiaboli TaxID=1960589 RepID=UPI000B43D518|nr:ABC transporter ATP-binding protein [Halalkalibacter urbisdiaboli]